MKKIIGMGCALLLLVGCGSTETGTTVCTGNIAGFEKNEVSYEWEGDKIIKSTTVFSQKMEGITEENKATVQQNFDSQYSEYNKTKGVKASIEIGTEDYTVTIVIDYEKADIKELTNLGIVDDSNGSAKYISVEKTLESMKALGLKCSEKK